MANMTKLAIFSIMLILATMTVSGQWLRDGYSNDRTYNYPSGTSTFNYTNVSTASITCGMSSSFNQYYTPAVLGTFGDSDSYPDMFLSCNGDSNNAIPHITMISDTLGVLDSVNLVSSEQLLDNWHLFSICEYDGNSSTTEFCILNPEDITPPLSYYSILVYSFDTEGTHEFTKVNEWFFNTTGYTVDLFNGSTFNLSGVSLSTYTDQYGITSFIECYETPEHQCYIMSGEMIFATNLTVNNTISWGIDMGHSIEVQARREERLPIFEDYYMYVLEGNNDTMYRINVSSGAYDAYELEAGTDEYEYWGLYDCTSADCVSNEEFVACDAQTKKCYMFDSEDGSLLESSNTLGCSSASVMYGWIQDTDSDGTEELCSICFHDSEAGTYDSTVHCEELNIFGWDTVEVDFALNETTDNGISSQLVRSDIYSSGLDDFIIGTNILGADVVSWDDFVDLLTGDYRIPVIQSLYDEVGTALIGSVYSLFDQSLTLGGTLISWYNGILATETIFITSTYGFGEAALANLPEFSGGVVQDIANPICNYSTVGFNCTLGNGCYTDAEYDRIGLCYDCFGDGSQADCFTSAEFFLNFDRFECDVTGKDGIQNLTVEIFEDGYEEYNDSYVHQYVVDSVGCNNETNPGELDVPDINIPPTFTGYPLAVYPEPYCRDATVRFICDTPDCYYDEEDDPVWFAIDCDGDGTYEKTTSVGVNNFTCTFNFYANESGSHTVSVQVRDLAHQSSYYDSVAFSVSISNYSRGDTEAAGYLLCSSASFFDSDGTINIPDAPPEESAATNAVYRYHQDIADIFDTTPGIVGWIFILTATGSVIWAGYRTRSDWTITGGALTFACLETFEALMGVHGYTMTIMMVVVAIGFGVYRHTSRGMPQ